MAKYKVVINSLENVRELLQEAYNQADEQLIQSQNEISKLSNSTKLSEEIMESKAKYAKAMNDYIGSREKAIGKKFEIAKLMAEIVKHNGDVAGTLNDKTAMKGLGSGFNLEELKRSIKEQMGGDDTPDTYQLKR